LPGMALNGLLTGAAGQINGTTRAEHDVDRVGVGTGVYSLWRSPADGVRAPAYLLELTTCPALEPRLPAYGKINAGLNCGLTVVPFALKSSFKCAGLA
jgi:hypothetical protein